MLITFRGGYWHDNTGAQQAGLREAKPAAVYSGFIRLRCYRIELYPRDQAYRSGVTYEDAASQCAADRYSFVPNFPLSGAGLRCWRRR